MLNTIDNGQLVRIFVGEGDRYENRPLYEAIMLAAREMGIAGATVLRGIAGYGAQSIVHTSRILRLSEDLPVVVEIVDSGPRINELLERVDAMLDEIGCGAMITLEKAQVLRYHPAESHSKG